MAAQRVPPSAWMTSQSTVKVRSPRMSSRVTARSERPMRRWISCVRPPTRPVRRFAGRARVRRARQHAVLGGHPAAAAIAQERRHAVLDADGAEDDGAAQLDEGGAFGVRQVAGRDAHRSQLVGAAAVLSFHGCSFRSMGSRATGV